MTLQGTQTYVIGSREFAVVDPGSAAATHLDALAALADEGVCVAVIVTHDHPDHIGGARELADRVGAPLLRFGDGLAAGTKIDTDAGELEALHTPGHTQDHVSLWWAAERALFEVSQKRTTRDFVSIAEVLDRFFDQIEYLQQHRGDVVGVPTGFADLDQLTGGMQRSDLIILAARPSMGKSALALGLAYGAAVQHGKTVGIFTLEMSAEQLVQRLLSTETGVDSHRLRLGQIDDSEWERISRALGRLSEANIFIDDSANVALMDVRSKARRLQAEHGVDMIIIDYLQLMSSNRRSDNRVQEISEISRGLKGLARELNVPVIALSQLSRAVETRSDHRPMLSDLRESGSIEQDADIVMFIYRDDKYDENSEKKGIAELIVAKHRNGPVGSVNLRFFERTARFADLELYREPEV